MRPLLTTPFFLGLVAFYPAGMAAGGGTRAVVAAVSANGFLTALKFTAYIASGSGAMLGESFHSLADTLNQALLYIGIRRSKRPPDRLHPYGYGQVQFFWGLLSGLGLFMLGCGMALYHGMHSLLHPHPIEIGATTWAILTVSFLLEGRVFLLALKSLREANPGKGLLEAVRTTSDVGTMMVLLEDAAACTGVLVASGAILLSQWTGSPLWDAIGTLAIGLLLGGVAVLVVVKNKHLLIDKAAPPEVEDQVRSILQARPTVTSVRRLRSSIFAADSIRLSADIDWNGEALYERALSVLADPPGDASSHDLLRRFSDALLKAEAKEIDSIEAELREKVEGLAYVQLESDE